MPRGERIIIPGLPHHVTQRGNNRQVVFRDDKDYLVYLHLLRKKLADDAVTLFAYCLMPNHVHLVLVPGEERAVTSLLKRLHQAYSLFFNEKYGRRGHLWQSRFYSCPVDERRVEMVVYYVERNPVTADICREAWDYPWSSAAAHCGCVEDRTSLLDMPGWVRDRSFAAWKALLARDDDAERMAGIRAATSSGFPFAGEARLDQLEARLGRPLRAPRRGRPKKTTDSAGKCFPRSP